MQLCVARVVVLPERVVGALVERRDQCEPAPLGGVAGRTVQQVAVEEERVSGAHLDSVPRTEAAQVVDSRRLGGRLLAHRGVGDPTGPVRAAQHLTTVGGERSRSADGGVQA